MTVYETTNHQQIQHWCESNGLWPGCAPGDPSRIRLGGDKSSPPEALDLLDWPDWFKAFDRRRLKFVYDPMQGWFDLQSRNVRAD